MMDIFRIRNLVILLKLTVSWFYFSCLLENARMLYNDTLSACNYSRISSNKKIWKAVFQNFQKIISTCKASFNTKERSPYDLVINYVLISSIVFVEVALLPQFTATCRCKQSHHVIQKQGFLDTTFITLAIAALKLMTMGRALMDTPYKLVCFCRNLYILLVKMTLWKCCFQNLSTISHFLIIFVYKFSIICAL